MSTTNFSHLPSYSRPMQQHCDPSVQQRWLFVEHWLQAVEPGSACESEFPSPCPSNRLPHEPSHRPSHKRKRAAPPAMSTPPPSHLSSGSTPRRGESPSKKRKLPDRSREQQDRDSDDVDNDPFISPTDGDNDHDNDPDPTPRRTNTGGSGSSSSFSFVTNAPARLGLPGLVKLPQPHPLQSWATTGSNNTSIPLAANTTTSPSIASSGTGTWTSTTTTSRARGTRRSGSPTKKTQTLAALKKPIYHVAIRDNATEQLPHDVRDLYNRLYGITVEHEGVFPSEVRAEIVDAVGRPLKDFWFRPGRRQDTAGVVGDGDDTGEQAFEQGQQEQQQQERARALALDELRALRKLERAAWVCRERGRSEAAWNLEVHGPLLELGLDRHPHVTRELATTAQVAKPFVPPMNDHSRNEFADRKMIDFVLVLDPDPDADADGEERGEIEEAGRDGDAAVDAADVAAATRYYGLAQAIKKVVHSQPGGRQTINQTAYTPLWHRPIAVSVETKADGMSEEGRTQLATWTAAWHERMRRLMDEAEAGAGEGGLGLGLGRDGRVVTLPVLLIVEHSWVLSFVCDRGDRLEVVGEVPLGDTSTLTGLYTLVAVVRELADWIEGPFCTWMEHVVAPFR